MSIYLGDAVSIKKTIIFTVLLSCSVIVIALSDIIEDQSLSSFESLVLKLSPLMTYAGIIALLASSTTWKWKRVINSRNNEEQFLPHKAETAKDEFQRRELFSIGFFCSLYGAAIQAANSFF